MRKIVTSLLMVAFLSLVFGSNITLAKEVTVKKGDTLWGLSQVHNTSVESLKNINNLSSNLIYPGQKLNTDAKVAKTAAKTAAGNVTVKKGDTLWGISRVHNTTVKSIKDINNLKSDFIYPGQKLSVAASATTKKASSSKNSSTAASSSSSKKSSVAASSSSSKKSSATAKKVSGKELTVTATAYTASCKGCSGITATGINLIKNPNQKVIAVDPDVIPLGSKVYVEGYGTAIAGDTGGAIQGNRIDVFIPKTDDAYKWGRKTVKITIL